MSRGNAMVKQNRNTLAVIGLSLLLAAVANAQSVPTTVTFTARLEDNGTPVQGNKQFLFKLFPTIGGGTEVWSETQTLTATDGNVSAELGASTPLSDTQFTGAKLFLEVAIDGTTHSPRTPVVSVPYAIRAGVAGKVGALADSDIQRRVSAAGCSVGSSIRVINADGSVTCESSSTMAVDEGVLAGDVNGPVSATTVRAIQGRNVAATAPADNQVLTWRNASSQWLPAAAVAGVTANPPLSSTGGSAPALSISQAGMTSPGFVSAADWSTFNAKQARVSGSCAVGNSIRQINADGTVVCQADNTGQTIAQIQSTTIPAGSFGTFVIYCPAGFPIAVGGGTDATDNTLPVVASSGPLINAQVLAHIANGQQVAPNGWHAVVKNTGPSPLTVKAAAICSK